MDSPYNYTTELLNRLKYCNHEYQLIDRKKISYDKEIFMYNCKFCGSPIYVIVKINYE